MYATDEDNIVMYIVDSSHEMCARESCTMQKITIRNIKQICAMKTNAVLGTFEPQGEGQGARSLPSVSNTMFSMHTPLTSVASVTIIRYDCLCVCVCVAEC